MDADIIRMAREADEYADKHTPLFVTVPNEWQEIRDKRFADLVRADEREACARVCEATDDGTPYNLTKDCAAAIRARNHQPPTAVADRLARHGIPMPAPAECADCRGIGYDASGQLCGCQGNPSF